MHIIHYSQLGLKQKIIFKLGVTVCLCTNIIIVNKKLLGSKVKHCYNCPPVLLVNNIYFKGSA